MSTIRRLQNIRKIAIIGGGPFGVAAAKFLQAEEAFETIDIFEQRSVAGGLWNYVPANDRDDQLEVPKTKPDGILEKPQWRQAKTNNGANGYSKTPTFSSPMYDLLEANLPKMLMQHSDLAFSDEDQLFPKHERILQYLEHYAEDVRHLITFETQATSVDLSYEGSKAQWDLTALNLRSLQSSTRTYDAILVASGHYSVPFIPEYTGMRDFNARYPNVITHAKHYHNPADFNGKKVLLIGTGPSGMDIVFQLAPFVKHLFISSRSDPKPMFAQLGNHTTQHSGIAEFLTPDTSDSNARPEVNRAIRFTDGTLASDLDAILFCTGYIYTYPFLPHDTLASHKLSPLITDGERVHNVYQHIFYTAEPTLAFGTLPWNIVPFPVSESQGAAIARVWSGRLTLPSVEDMAKWEEDVAANMGSGKAFHRLPTPKDAEYINELFSWCESADGEQEGSWRKPPYWGGWMMWLRKNVWKIKGDFAMMGIGRERIKSLEDLGYRYENHQVPQQPKSL